MILVSSSLKMLTKIFLSLLPQNILKNPRAPIFLSTLLIYIYAHKKAEQ